MYKKPTNQQEYEENFALKNPLMDATEAKVESARCLFCYDAPCIKACPTGIDIPLFIKQILTENTIGAGRTTYATNWLANACGTICPTGVLCEGACVYRKRNQPPVQIGRLQQIAAQALIRSDYKAWHKADPTGKRVAIIGAGPAGIACASELRTLGHEVHIYEAKDRPSGLIIHGVAPYKITNASVLEEIDYLHKQLGFVLHYNHPIDQKTQIQNLESDFDAIFLGVGLDKTRLPSLPGISMQGVVGAVEFIEDFKNQKHQKDVPKEVIVIGGGNTAMDAASECARMGAQVSLVYRRPKSQMGAYEFEWQLAYRSGVRTIFSASPIEVLGDKVVRGVRFAKTISEGGHLRILADTEFELGAQLLILATGQHKQLHLFDLIDGLELDAQSRIIINEGYQTTNPKYFAGGDAVNGGAEVVHAVRDGKAAAIQMHRLMVER